MEIWVVLIISLLALLCAGSMLYMLSLRASLKEVARELDGRLKTDTNTLISISSGDRAVRALAAKINDQLKALRKERLKLQHGDMELKNAVTNISHDLRTPLTAICGYLDLLEEEAIGKKQERYLAVLRERTEAMRGLSEELFRYSLAVTAAEELKFERVSLNDILEQSIAGFYGALSDRGIVPDIFLAKSPIVRSVDKQALRRIFDNIISNAVRYSDGDLTVSLSNDGKVIFENGANELDAVQTAHLFDRFFTVTTARGGTGLGLSIAKLLTEKMNGQITAKYDNNKLSIFVSFSNSL